MTDKHDVVPIAAQAQTRAIMHPLVERMLEKSPTPEALVELKRALPAFLEKDTTVDFTGNSGKRTTYTHTSLAAAMEVVTPHLCEYGFALTWKPGTKAKGDLTIVTVTAKLTHRQGHVEEVTLEAPPDMSGNKSSPQGIASTITLLERYSALAALGLSSRDMKEPTGEGDAPEAASERIDTSRNMRAMSDLAKLGKTKEVVEKFLGKKLPEWNSKDLDKLRAWIEPPPPPPIPPAAQEPATKPPPAVLIGKEEIAELKALATAYNLKREQFSAIVAEELGRKATSADMTKPEHQKIVALFGAIQDGKIQLTAGKIVRPPPAVLNPGPSGKSVEQLEREAIEEDLPL